MDYVNPFIGTITESRKVGSTSRGRTFPGAATPYGLVQLSPDSISGGDNGSGYNFEHGTIMGFSFTHMSGIGWYDDLGNLLVTPTTGPLRTSYGETDKPGSGYLSRKADETAAAGYPGGDEARTPRRSDRYTRRTIFSGWDVYRNAFPLMTLIAPEVVGDTIDSLCDLADESGKGYLERWEFLNAYSGCMNGNPAVIVINDAYQKELRNFDVPKAYRLAKSTCGKINAGEKGFSGNLSDTGEYNLADWSLYNGLCGDEDVGQMSGWFILAASGLHQACPGDTRYELFTPLFDRVEIRIDPIYGKDRRFVITTCGNGPGERYIRSAALNGQPLSRRWLDHREIISGGTLELELELELGTTPDTGNTGQ